MKTTKKVTAEKLTDSQRIFNEYKLKQRELQERIDAEKAEKRKRKTRSTHITLKNSVLIQILNSGDKGLSVSEIMNLTPITDGAEKYSLDTIARDWNVRRAEQSEERNLHKKGVMVLFTVDVDNPMCDSLKGAKQNNRIFVPTEFRDTLKDYLLSKNATEEMFV